MDGSREEEADRGGQAEVGRQSQAGADKQRQAETNKARIRQMQRQSEAEPSGGRKKQKHVGRHS